MKFFLNKIEQEQKRRVEIQHKGSRGLEPNLLALSHAIDNQYFVEKLEIYCSYLSYTRMVHKKVIGYDASHLRLIKAIMKTIEGETNWHPLIQLYYTLCRLFETIEKDTAAEALAAFEQVEVLLETCRTKLTKRTLTNIYSKLTNYLTYQINHGRRDFFIKNIIHNYHIIDLNQKVRKSFPSGVYTNTIHLILKLEELNAVSHTLVQNHIPNHIKTPLDWAEHFAETYRYKLSNRDRKNYYGYNKALILFTKGAFKACLLYTSPSPRDA